MFFNTSRSVAVPWAMRCAAEIPLCILGREAAPCVERCFQRPEEHAQPMTVGNNLLCCFRLGSHAHGKRDDDGCRTTSAATNVVDK